MRRISSVVGMLLAVALLLAAASAADAATPLLPPTTVELAIHGPNGQPVADTDITLFSGDEYVAAKTDADGLARFSWPYPAPIFVRVPGVGYGATGLFPLHPGKTVRVALPRLAPFGVIEGTVPAELRKPGLIVSNDPYGMEKWLRCEAATDNNGQFILKDVPAGDCSLAARVKGKTHPLAYAAVFVDPGERVGHVTMLETSPSFEPEPVPLQPNANQPAPEEKEPKPVPWAEGMVRDATGRPLEGATVFASVLEHGGTDFVNYGTALTDGEGRWQVVGPPWPSPWPYVSKGELLVCRFGYSCAVVPMRCPKPPESDLGDFKKPEFKPQASPTFKPQRFEVSLSANCGGMEVLVTRNGKPLADTTVSVAEDAPEELVLGPASEAAAWDEAAQRILHPVSVTGEDGIASFNRLAPGKYAILIYDGLPDPRFVWQLWERDWQGRYIGPGPAYHGIVVEPGKVRKFHALLHAGDYSVPLRVMNPDGKPAAGLETGWWADRQRRETCDADGFVVKHYDGPGLKEFACTYLEDKSAPAPYGKNEYFKSYREIKSTLAASELLRSGATTTVTAIASENVPGSLVVHLQNRDGEPAAGYVFVFDNQGRQREASTDEKGEVRFDGMAAEAKTVGAILPGMKLPQFDEHSPPLPKDKELIGHWTVFSKPFNCPLGVETRLILRPAPACYIRGVVRPATGRNIENYSLGDLSVPKSGEFLLGPYPEGKTVLRLRYWPPNSQCEECAQKEVDVRTDRVAHVEFDETKSPRALPGQARPCSGEDFSPDVDVEASVYLPDGRTPALGAQVALLVPNGVGALQQGTTDARGRCSIAALPAQFSWPTGDLESKRGQIPDEPTFVAWMPGEFGPAIALAKSADDKGKLRIVLPQSAAQRGKIMIGGKVLAEQRGELRVMAAREGTRPLNALFSQYVSADPEGNFELPALAPGVYQVQAALDNIWLSPSVRVTVAADAAPLKPITLDIGEPGPASTVAVVDRHGKALADVQVTIDRPPGPLATLLWTHLFKTDGAGVAQIPPLEAGRHEVRIAGIPSKSTLLVPPLGDPKATPASLRAIQ